MSAAAVHGTPAQIRQATWATRALFAALGVLSAAWGVHIPSVKAHYGLGEGALSLVLVAAASGAVLALFFAGRVIGRLGARNAAALCALVMAFSLGMALAILYKFVKGAATQNEIFLAAWLAGVSYPFVVLLKYYMLMIAPMVILTSICLLEVFRFLKGRANLYVKSLMVASVLILLALSVAVNLYSEYKLQKYRPDFFGNVLKASEYIANRTASGEKIYIFGYAEDIYFFSGRNPPVGLFYVYPRPLTTPEEEESTIRIITNSDVKIIVVAYKEQPLKYYVPSLYGYIQKEYKLEESFGVFDIYSKKL